MALLQASVGGGMKLSTGVFVLYADEESFTFMTPQGHMFAGWITFSAEEVDGATVAQCQVLMRAQDPLTEVGLVLGGHRQDRFWQDTMRALAARFEDEAEPGDERRVRRQEAPVETGRQRAAFERLPLERPHRHGAAPEAQVASPHV